MAYWQVSNAQHSTQAIHTYELSADMSTVMSAATFMLSVPVIDLDTNPTDWQKERERGVSLSSAPQQLLTKTEKVRS